MALSHRRTKTTIFLHIPKTAGSTVRTVLSQNYHYRLSHAFSGKPEQFASFRNRPAAQRNKFDLIHGHCPYGIHDCLDRDVEYFTFLRNPINRYFSDFFFAGIYEDHNLHDQIRSGEFTIHDYARQPEQEPYFENLMTQYLGGELFCRPDEEDLERAKQRLENDFVAFGISERFDESLLLIARALKWKKPFFLNKNISEQTIREVPQEAIDIVMPYLEKDMALYNYACQLFAARVAAAGPSLERALAALRAVENGLHENYDRQKHRIYVVGRKVDSCLKKANRFTGLPFLDNLLCSKEQLLVQNFVKAEAA